MLLLGLAPLTATSLKPWHIPPRAPTIRLLPARGCPQSLGHAQDVANRGSWVERELVPASPVGGLICRYAAARRPSSSPTLAHWARLDRAQARRLAGVIRELSTRPPSGAVACPAGFYQATLIALSYRTRAPADLWYQDTGCRTLDNGWMGASEIANPGFYGRFAPLLDRLCAPPPPPGAALPASPEG